jgi:pimeloyl-ACP methyl ester carboxylesterase
MRRPGPPHTMWPSCRLPQLQTGLRRSTSVTMTWRRPRWLPVVFKDEFRCITMDQRNANGGESTGPIPVSDPWGAFADDQLGLMDHLGITQFLFMGYCIGGCFAMKLMERAPERVVAGVLVQTVGHHPEHPDYMYNSGRDVWAPELLPRRPDLNMENRALSP